MITRKPLDENDFILFSLDRKSSVHFSFADLEAERYPSISYKVEIIDHSFRGSTNICLEKHKKKEFLTDLIEINKLREGFINIKSMSPEEFEISLESIRLDRFIINYSLQRNRYSENYMITTKLNGSFEFDSEYFNKFEKDIRRIYELLN
ncbi:hypothetical protein [Cohnella sp. WQ 127256]|uniref:hypothetical protein n=1 Tax=Cohnella sp. WQ 127256 TaxID=2938790 RepID=UPI0021177184|nr:hypothetical protein [Cohnella sp. WQ 127256]